MASAPSSEYLKGSLCKTAYTVPAPVLRRTAIDEVGIPAEAGAYADPWAWNNQHGAEDDQVQARWFEAVCDAATAAHMRAIYFWTVNLIDNPEDPSCPW